MIREDITERAGISREKLRRMVNADAVTPPERGNRGRAGGRSADYPPESLWETIAANHLLKHNSLEQIAELRKAGRLLISEACEELGEVIDDFEKWQDENTIIDVLEGERGEIVAESKILPNPLDFPPRITYIDHPTFTWLLVRIKAEHDFPIDEPAEVIVDCFGIYPENQGPDIISTGFDTLLDWGKMGNRVAHWCIKDIKHSSNGVDNIVIQDHEPQTRLILQSRKNRI